ncbi:dihydrolipoyl dehydrogenase family protein [Smaragdicoccus niigatensis]|uniref:dihydrolipoyl dehydrogenase family protein n=1 Tax=Smaragdicoccus niigatensis TaxID=359359 RepID=UPI0003A1C2A6|nr:NAD(P)/FAD-dependent oxidoreductase [Smaragdicoccus niigatensis]
MSQHTSADVIVVGLGVAGESIGGQLAKAGLDVVGIESELVGGECPYWGCIPSKMMIRAANLLAEARRIPGMAGSVSDISPDWSPVAERIRKEATDTWDDTVAVERFQDAGGHFIRGQAKILDTKRVEIDGQVIEARKALVITTGTAASIPPIPGLKDTPYWTNREAIATETLPKSLLVIGAGAIGCEIGQTFARFGVDVTIADAADRVLPLEEPDSSKVIADVFEKEGIGVRVGLGIERVEHSDNEFRVFTKDGGDPLVAEKLLIATGRRARVDEQTLTSLGLSGKPGPLPVDDRLRVTDGVWAAGDVAGKGAFTHVATYHADIVVRDILGQPGPAAQYHALPRVSFTDPEVGSVGLTESQAREQGISVATGSAQTASSSRGWIHKAGNEGFIKLVVDADQDIIVGATSIGPCGGEVLSALSVAVHARVPVSTLESMIYAYPTFHRGIQDAIRHLRADQNGK